MLARLFYNDEMSEMPADEAWFKNAITLLAGKGVLDNTSAALKNYDANSVSAPMNRYDMAQTMYGLLKAEGVPMPSDSELQATAQRIADFNTIPAQYTDAVKNMYDLGCLAGVDAAGNFKGENTMNRAQACVVLARLEKTIADREAGEVPAKPSDPAEQEPPTETTDPGTTSTEWWVRNCPAEPPRRLAWLPALARRTTIPPMATPILCPTMATIPEPLMWMLGLLRCSMASWSW